MTPDDNAIAGLAEDVGKALLVFAERLRSAAEATAAAQSPWDATRPPKLGKSQEAVLEALRDAGRQGLTSVEVAAATGKADSNTPRMLKTLAARGLVLSKDATPAVWTAVPQVV